jgi:hypothetical protein
MAVPAHIVVTLAEILTEGVVLAFTTMVIGVEFAVPMLAQAALLVIWQVITSPFTKEVEV